MPLRDHFHPPLSDRRHWEGFHSRWASAIVDRLNEGLPERYYAEPHVHRGAQFEIDVATFEDESIASGGRSEGGTLVWAPSRPAARIPVDAASFDVFEVRIVNDEAGPKLVAAIELVSPANKDRASHRRAFAVKCAAYIQQGVSVLVVDTVTTRHANLHDEMLSVMQVGQPTAANPHRLYSVAYRIAPSDKPVLELWLEPMALAEPLPTMPLWISSCEAVPVELEETYLAACRNLRMGD